MKKLFVYLMLVSLFFNSLPVLDAKADSQPVIDVKLINYLGNKSEISLKPSGDYIINNNFFLKADVSYTIKLENGKIVLYQGANRLNEFETFQVKPASEDTVLTINGRRYLGSFNFVIENNQYIRPINSVLMEDYVRGVVPHEMYPNWNIEALKVQAVAARTYAMTYLNKTIDDTILYQVYGGKSLEANSNKAVSDTEGEVLKYNGKLISAVFSASNGGVMESNANAWGSSPVPYLEVKEDPYDPKMTWSLSLNKKQIDLTNKDLANPDSWWASAKETDTVVTANIKTWLTKNGYAGKEIKVINIPYLSLQEPASGGRASKGSLTVEFFVKDARDADGKLVLQKLELMDVKATKIRAIIGNRVILSYLVDVVNHSSSIIEIKGRGDGHGVGMSQYGAKKAADLGKTYQEILSFYYKGTTLVKDYSSSVTPPAVPAANTEVNPQPAAGKQSPAVPAENTKVSPQPAAGKQSPAVPAKNTKVSPQPAVKRSPAVPAKNTKVSPQPAVKRSPAASPTNSKTSSTQTKSIVKVTYVRNGSTVRGYVNNKAVTIKLIGVNISHPYAQKAAYDFTKRKMLNRTLTLEFDSVKYDKDGSLLAYVWSGTSMINQALVREGYATASKTGQNVKYSRTFGKLEQEASARKLGLWSK